MILGTRQTRCERTSLLVALAVLLVSGCAAPRPATVPEPEPDPGPAGDPVDISAIDHSAYEDFDVSPYEDEPEPREALAHDVPEQLLAGRAGSGTVRVLEGYRIQLFQTRDPEQAESAVERATEWWRGQKEVGNRSDLFVGSDPPVYNIWRQPYYRVRVGDFASRAQAERALEEVNDWFEGAVVVPDRVNLLR